jgi:hypothetical protein
VSVGRITGCVTHETVPHGRREYVRGPVHANSVEGFNLRVQRTVAGVFHHISPEHADLYFHEIGFRWSQRIAEGEVSPTQPAWPRKDQNPMVTDPNQRPENCP